ncbi:potassium channel family protein [Aestuariibacter halophilus]|uniref:Potassium channel family protein n=1 Tax=Fluctibacter halophilus TaxID=226011 RepID=A0ABS8G945_9ALTE|nr:ion channel [Aestuariibacter halophilus]MCC2617065.1 potassium channel family protein [Aestuariibacter halophilus]
MYIQLFIGTLAITSTIVVQVIVMRILAEFYRRHQHWLSTGPEHMRTTIAMILSVLWLVVGITINTWGWAFIFLAIDEFPDIETALYFAISSFTTLGYGDLILSHEWRILGALSAVNGLIVFGLNTAFLLELMIRTWGRRAGM